MAGKLILTGDVNLMNVTDAAIPFRQIATELHAADVVFGNLECCLHVPARRSHDTEGFFADPEIGGEALRLAGFHAVGVANNVNYGADNIAASLSVAGSAGHSAHRRRPQSGRGARARAGRPQRAAHRRRAAQFGVLANRPRSRR